MKSKKNWQEKMNKKQDPIVKEGLPAWNSKFGGARMLIANPQEVNLILKKLSKGDLLTMKQLREELAEKFSADYTCPLTTGIFLRIVAEAMEEKRAEGKEDLSPWWRIVGEKGELNPKLPGNALLQAKLLTQEGIKVTLKGKKWIALL